MAKFLLPLFLLAVAATASDGLGPKPRLPKNALPVPLVRQSTTWSCGAASVMAVLYYWQKYDGPESELFKELNTTEENGTAPWNMTRVLKDYGLEARFLEGLTLEDLRKYLAQGYTVIVDYQAWREDDGPWSDRWEDGHYSVLVGMDSEFIYVMDPSTASSYGYIPLGEFLERWHDYEIRDGKPVRYFNEGIVVKGTHPLTSIPAPLVRVQ